MASAAGSGSGTHDLGRVVVVLREVLRDRARPDRAGAADGVVVERRTEEAGGDLGLDQPVREPAVVAGRVGRHRHLQHRAGQRVGVAAVAQAVAEKKQPLRPAHDPHPPSIERPDSEALPEGGYRVRTASSTMRWTGLRAWPARPRKLPVPLRSRPDRGIVEVGGDRAHNVVRALARAEGLELGVQVYRILPGEVRRLRDQRDPVGPVASGAGFGRRRGIEARRTAPPSTSAPHTTRYIRDLLLAEPARDDGHHLLRARPRLRRRGAARRDRPPARRRCSGRRALPRCRHGRGRSGTCSRPSARLHVLRESGPGEQEPAEAEDDSATISRRAPRTRSVDGAGEVVGDEDRAVAQLRDVDRPAEILAGLVVEPALGERLARRACRPRRRS